MADADKLICLITGANQGIGLEVARALVSRGQQEQRRGRPYHVLVGSRDLARGQAAVDDLLSSSSSSSSASAIQLDVTDAASVAAAAARVRAEHGRLDVLVNNAGVASRGRDAAATLAADLATNVVGAARATEAFLPLLLAGKEEEDARLVFVSSSMGSLAGAADPGGRYYRGAAGTSPMEYRVSKAGVNMLMLEYWKRHGAAERCGWEGDGDGDGDGDGEGRGKRRRVRVWAADPGANATNLTGAGMAERARAMGLPGPEVGARVIVGCVTGERDGEEGRVVGAYGIGPW